MKRESIFFTITMGFILSMLLVIASFLILIMHDFKVNEEKYLDKYIPIIKMISKEERMGFSSEFIENLKEIHYELLLESKHVNAITYNPKTTVLFERVHPKHNDIFRVLKLNGINYVYFKKQNGVTFLVKDNETPTNTTFLYIVLIFGCLFFMVILVYLTTLRKLIPLKILKEKVMTLGDENFDFECCNNNKQDEVSLLAQEFKKSAQKLKKIKEARNVFIRNIMHELKTPITKGKFLVQLPQTEENNEKMKNVFNRLESLINEFSSIEEVISSSKQFDHANYFLNDLVDNAVDILMLDEEVIHKEFENIKLNVNFKLFSVAIKNLIDNAIKHSNDGKVTIKTEQHCIVFENTGNSLEHELDNYFEPFFANNNTNSFGLGLYIVNSILKANGYFLEYSYENNLNRFVVKPNENSNGI